MSAFEIPSYADYEGLLSLTRNAGTNIARMFIPRLCQQLKKENPEMPNEDVKEAVTNDCADIWSKATIRKFMPEEYKDPQKQESGKMGREKQLENPITTGTSVSTGMGAGMNRAEDGSSGQTEQYSERFEDVDRGPNVKPTNKMISELQNELKNVRETYEAKLKEATEKLDFAQSPENLEKVPELVDNKVGAVKVQNLSKISEFDRRGYKILAGRLAELVKRKITEEGKAAVKLYVMTKDRTNNIEYLVPITFVINMLDKSTDVILDESRL